MFTTSPSSLNSLEIKTRLNFASTPVLDCEPCWNRLQGSSFSEFSTQDSSSSQWVSEVELSATSTLEIQNFERTKPLLASHFSSVYGYGLVDAAAAVGKAIGRSRLDNVSNYNDYNWGVDAVYAPEVWARGFTGQDVVVAVIDSGVDFLHDDLDDNLWFNSREVFGNGVDDDRNGYVDDVIGWDFIDYDNNPMDFDGHGTHVAGTIAAERNRFGTTGIAYNAKIMPLRVLSETGGGEREIAAGIVYASNNGADVINLSLSTGTSELIAQAVRYATQRGSMVVMAAGNQGEAEPRYPARLATNWGIAVGAIDAYGEMADFSNWAGRDAGMHYVVAPGVDIYSTLPGDSYGSTQGTSMAAPHVSGVVALMLSANPKLTPEQVQKIIVQTAIS